MATEAVVETAVQAVETGMTVEKPVEDVVKRVPKNKTALIVGGTAGAVIVGYFVVRKFVIPKVTKKHHCECKNEEPKETEEPKNVEKEETPEKEAKSNKKK